MTHLQLTVVHKFSANPGTASLYAVLPLDLRDRFYDSAQGKKDESLKTLLSSPTPKIRHAASSHD